MSDTYGPQAETTTEQRKPPTLADIVREKTDDGRRIIDFFLDVMEDRIDGAELCHRIDAAKQLEKHKSKAAARFIAKHRGVPCGHSTRGRPGPADPCAAEERSLVAVTLNAPATLTQDFLTVLSGIDEFLMARLIRAQTADGDTIIEFLDDVMQDRNEGFKCHHRIAAAKELIVHIVRDESPEPAPGEAPSSPNPEPNSIVVPAEAGTHPAPNSTIVPAKAGTHPLNPEPVLSTVEGPLTSVHPEPGSPEPVERVEGARPEFTEGPALSTAEGPVPSTVEEPVLSLPKGPADNSSVVPAKEPAEGRQDHKERNPRRRRTRTQRRQHGAARAATLGKHPSSERNKEDDEHEKPAPVELTPAERRIREKLKAHWHEPDPWAAPIDSTTQGRSPPL